MKEKKVQVSCEWSPHEREQLKRALNEETQTEMDKKQLRQLLIFHLLVAKDGFSLEELSEKLYVGKRTDS